METATVIPGEQHIAGDDGFLCCPWPAAQPELAGYLALVGAGALGEQRVLAVLGEQHVLACRVLECAPHNLRIGHALAVIREHGDVGEAVLHQPELGECGALEPLGDGADGVDIYEPVLFALEVDRLGDNRVIIHRLCVGHGHDRGEAATSGSPRAGFDCLGVLTPRLAEVHVNIDEPG